MRGQELYVLTTHAGLYAANALGTLVVWFRVEGYAFEVLATVMAEETFRVEARAGGGDDATRDGKRAVLAQSTGTD